MTRDGHLDVLTVHVECDGAIASSEERRKRATGELAQHVKAYIGISALIVVRDPGAIERSIGKAKRVVDKRPKGNS